MNPIIPEGKREREEDFTAHAPLPKKQKISEENPYYLTELPPELIKEFFSYLSPLDAHSLFSTCRTLYCFREEFWKDAERICKEVPVQSFFKIIYSKNSPQDSISTVFKKEVEENTKIIEEQVFTYIEKCQLGTEEEKQAWRNSKGTFKNFEKVFELILAKKNLTTIPNLSSYQNIVELDISFNSLTTLSTELNELTNLEFLYAQGNKIQTISKGIFKNLKKLKLIWLQENKLKSLPKKIGFLEHLEELDVRKNKLTEIPIEILSRMDCDILYRGNPMPPPLIEYISGLNDLFGI